MSLPPVTLFRLLVVLALPLVLWLLPLRVSPRWLMMLAFSFWMAGGIVLCAQGLSFLELVEPNWQNWLLPLGIALAIGWAKGTFVLSKTSQRNIDRLLALPGKARLVHVYSVRSWVIIGVMLLLGLSFTVFNMDLFWRGVVNVGIGFALVVSAQRYTRALHQLPAAAPRDEAATL